MNTSVVKAAIVQHCNLSLLAESVGASCALVSRALGWIVPQDFANVDWPMEIFWTRSHVSVDLLSIIGMETVHDECNAYRHDDADERRKRNVATQLSLHDLHVIVYRGFEAVGQSSKLVG